MNFRVVDMRVEGFANSIKDCGQNFLNFQKQANFEKFTCFCLLFYVILDDETFDFGNGGARFVGNDQSWDRGWLVAFIVDLDRADEGHKAVLGVLFHGIFYFLFELH